MIFLADFTVIKPDFGLLFWTTIIFLLFWFIIGKFAFRPIAEALKERERDIQDSLDEAKKARQEMANLKSENEALLAQAREERSKILKDAKDARDNIINEAKDKLTCAAENTDADKIKACIKQLERVSESFVARRMNQSVRQAMKGKTVEEFSK